MLIYVYTRGIANMTLCLFLGAAVGLNSALIAIVTDWLSDIKIGYCSNGWWLNQKYCCWEIEQDGKKWQSSLYPLLILSIYLSDGGCDYWVYWSQTLGLDRDAFVIQWLFYVALAVGRDALIHALLLTVNVDFVCNNMCLSCQSACSLCRWFRHIRD